MNTRWRQYRKMHHLPKWDKWDLAMEYSPHKRRTCPACGGEIWSQSWSDERSLVETLDECETCNYQDHWSYGHTYLTVGKWEDDFSFNTPARDEIISEFGRQAYLIRTARRQAIRKYYRKVAKRK